MKSQQPQHKKEANVGDLLVQTLKQNAIVKLAVWYRVVGQTSKIVKMQRIKVNQNISYRCTVFDVGADIVLKLENQQSCQTKVFGPVKFDLSLSKQLDDHKNLHCSFNICIHSKSNSSTSAKIKTAINQQGKLLLHLQVKNQPEIIFKIPLKTDWRNYEQFFDTHDLRLTDVIIKEIQPEKTFKQKLKSVNICARNSNSLQITFTNGSQRNIFLAQILKKTRDLSQTAKNSQFKSNHHFQHKIQDEIDDLFKSSMSSHYFNKNLQISDKIVGQIKNIIFSPNNSNQDINDVGSSFQSFDNFINPENDYHKFPKLSEILQEQTQMQDKSTINIQKYDKSNQKTLQKLGSTKKIQPILSKSSLHSRQSQQTNWSKLAVQNKTLSKQMDVLKKQNMFLRKKLLNIDYKNKHFKSIQYQMPSEVRNYYKKMNESKRKSRERAYSHQQKITSTRQKTFWTQQTSQVIHQHVPNKFFLSSNKKSPTQSVVKQDKIKQSTKTITTSSKSVKQFTGIGSVSSLT